MSTPDQVDEPAASRERSAETTPVPAAPVPPAPAPPVPTPPAAQTPGPRRATRILDGSWLGGVCTGLAHHLNVPVMVIRVGFVLLLMASFAGAVVYGVLWLLLPPDPGEQAPGLASHSRTGMRSTLRRRSTDLGALLALVLIGVGTLWFVQSVGLGLDWRVFWPILLALTGAALLWRQADQPIRGGVAPQHWYSRLLTRGGWAAVLRVVVGLGLIAAATLWVVAVQGNLALMPQVLALTALALSGVALVAAPWVHRMRTSANRAREEKVRADERADMAAHLHDSVLQTLALIQRQADDPKAVQQIARRQERELRTWLYGAEADDSTFAAALTTAASEVEDERGVPVEVVQVGGDTELTPALTAVVAAAREAILNAAKHSGAPTIDVYAELSPERVEVFVKDRGTGFDLDAVPDDRLGLRGSIIERMERHGGRAIVRSVPNEGTEVRLEMTR